MGSGASLVQKGGGGDHGDSLAIREVGDASCSEEPLGAHLSHGKLTEPGQAAFEVAQALVKDLSVVRPSASKGGAQGDNTVLELYTMPHSDAGNASPKGRRGDSSKGFGTRHLHVVGCHSIAEVRSESMNLRNEDCFTAANCNT